MVDANDRLNFLLGHLSQLFLFHYPEDMNFGYTPSCFLSYQQQAAHLVKPTVPCQNIETNSALKLKPLQFIEAMCFLRLCNTVQAKLGQ